MKAQHHPVIRTGRDFRESLRAGPYAWPGGYAVVYVCDDGAALCAKCAKSEAPLILRSIHAGIRDGWRVIGCQTVEVADEFGDETCAHCGIHLSTI